MTDVRKTALVAFSAESMFDLIEQAEHYPRFLPWCAAATILARDDDTVSATITVDYHGVRFNFSTCNPKRRPEYLAVRFTEGPFRRLEGEWHLKALADDACRIDFRLLYEFDSGIVARLAGPVFDGIANTLVTAFVNRAEKLHSEGEALPAPQAGVAHWREPHKG